MSEPETKLDDIQTEPEIKSDDPLKEPETKSDDPQTEPEKEVNDPQTEPEKDPHEEPEKEVKDQQFSYFDPIAGIIVALIATVVFLGFPGIITVVFIGGVVIPTFEEEVIRSLWIPIILWAVFRIGVDVAYIAEHSYTKRLAKISVIGHILTAICTIIIFIDPRIVHPEYVDWVNTYFASVSVEFGNILARPNLIILVLILVVLIIESITVIRKGYRAEDTDDEDAGGENADGENADGGGNIERTH